MKKEAYYFPHDSNARNDNRIIAVRMKYGAEGYGIYFMIIEKMRECADYKCVKDYNVIAFDLRVDASIVKSIVEDFGLFVFTDDGKYIYSESLLQRMNPLDELRKKRSDAGKSGMEKRWKSTELQQTYNTVITNLQDFDNNKSKVNKVKENNKSSECLNAHTREHTQESDFEIRKSLFYNQCASLVEKFGKKIVREFFDYWTEPNKSHSRMRFELERTWDLEKRLQTWDKNESIFNKNGTNQRNSKAGDRRPTTDELDTAVEIGIALAEADKNK